MNMILSWSYPRKYIKVSLECLIDPEIERKWFDPNYKHAFWDSLDYWVFDYLIDGGLSLIDNADQEIGRTLYNKEEADIISQYLTFYNNTFEGELPDSYYINHPRWSEVIEGAKRIVELMERNNIKYNFQNDIKIFDERHNKSDRCIERVSLLTKDNPEISYKMRTNVQTKLNILFPYDFKRLCSFYGYNFFRVFPFYNFENEEGVIGETLRLRRECKLPDNYLVLAQDDHRVVLMKINSPYSSEVILCSYYDFNNICAGKPMEENPTIFPCFVDFYEFLLDEEEKIQAEDQLLDN